MSRFLPLSFSLAACLTMPVWASKAGLTLAKELQSLMGRIVNALEAEKQLPVLVAVEKRAKMAVECVFLSAACGEIE